MQTTLSLLNKRSKCSAMLALLFMGSFITSCMKEEMVPEIPSEISQEVRDYFHNKGFDGENITKDDQYYRVEGDILFSVDRVHQQLQRHENNGPTTEQYYLAESVINTQINADIKIALSPFLVDFRDEYLAAINQWNSIPNFKITLIDVSATGNYDILVEDGATSSCGESEFPSNGAPGSVIKINKANMSQDNYSDQDREGTIAHEIGHALGFMHANVHDSQFGSVPVPGVEEKDYNSLMVMGRCATNITKLNEWDKLAAQSVYPESSCYYSEWKMDYIDYGSYVLYSVREINDYFNNIKANQPVLNVYSLRSTVKVTKQSANNERTPDEIYYVYAGKSIDIPMGSSGNCATNPNISTRLIFEKLGNPGVFNQLTVKLKAVSSGHIIDPSEHKKWH